jgi:predicted phosphodiesterase
MLCAWAQEAPVAPPARNWTLPLFTKEGFHQMTLRGDEVRPVSADRIDVTGMNVTVFSGNADAKVDSVLVSPQATFLLNEKIARGDRAVRLVRDDVDVRGEGWNYSYNEKKVLIFRHAHVVFHSALPDMLK